MTDPIHIIDYEPLPLNEDFTRKTNRILTQEVKVLTKPGTLRSFWCCVGATISRGTRWVQEDEIRE